MVCLKFQIIISNATDVLTFSRFARNHLYHSIRVGRKIDVVAKDDALLSKLVCDTDQVVSGSPARGRGRSAADSRCT